MRFLTLRYFNEVAKLGSIRKAADRLHVAPSAVSRQIAQLEHELDAVLFERSKVGVQLTPAGEVLARQSNRIFRDLARARNEIDDLRGLRRGEVSLYVIEGLVSGLLPDLLANFHHRYPAVTFRIQTGSTDRIIEALLEDEADIGITFNAIPRPEIEVIAEHVEPIACLVAPTHEFANRTSLTLDDICSQTIALPEHSFGLRQVFERAIAKRQRSPQVLVTTNSLELTKRMAATGQVIAFMPALTVITELHSDALRAIPIADPAFAAARSSISIHRDRPLPHAPQEFLKALADAIRGLSKRKKLR
ncbi:LysR family transcriptional regulator [Rhodopseudomonas sp. HC1]|uniref:LysR family transcriptional regulator n=1 Tax=Rhodopseudomonas infernalis TaxID=2897386 RepID=UPI001EE823B1|nr:LysR family transcriptional regulator [Rhodopseudomonas infernalis]MCG6204978.1 LysR family transcriptional regulator [Rhodopseudomonas infernalis]